MATVYGYFRSDEEARRAAARFEQLGLHSSVMTHPDQPAYLSDDEMRSVRSEDRLVLRYGLIAAVVVAILGTVVYTVIPGLWNKAVLAGPLLMVLYGIAVGLSIGIWINERRRNRVVEHLPTELSSHPRAERVLVIHLDDLRRAREVEQLLESDGAVEVVHRAA